MSTTTSAKPKRKKSSKKKQSGKPSTGLAAAERVEVTDTDDEAAASKPLALVQDYTFGARCIPVDLIDVDRNGNHREPASGDKQSIDDLAKSISRNGLLCPILVFEQGNGRYRLCYGHRRLQAFKLLKVPEIPALVHPNELGEYQVENARAVENIQRADLNAIEEAIAVATLLDRHRKSFRRDPGRQDHVAEVAATLGRSETWVRDRSYLGRLSGDARQLVLEGSLPLAHAREVAKLADPAQRDDIARCAARRADGTGGMGLDRLKRWISRLMLSLRVVPWDLSAEFVGKPACDHCPSNSVNDRMLFEHDEQAPPDTGICMNPRCFKEKQRACEKAMNLAVKKVELKLPSKPTGSSKQKKKKADAQPETPAVTVTTLARDACPSYVKESSFVRRAKRVCEPPQPGGAKKKNEKARGRLAATIGPTPKQEYAQALRQWAKTVKDMAINAGKGNQRLAVCLLLYCEIVVSTPARHLKIKDGWITSLLKSLADHEGAGLDQLIASLSPDIWMQVSRDVVESGLLYAFQDCDNGKHMAAVADCLKLKDVPPMPELKDFT